MLIPSLGRTVLYTSKDGKTRPAIIVNVNGPAMPETTVNLCVFTDWKNDASDSELAWGSATGTVHALTKGQAETPTPGKWCAPPRV